MEESLDLNGSYTTPVGSAAVDLIAVSVRLPLNDAMNCSRRNKNKGMIRSLIFSSSSPQMSINIEIYSCIRLDDERDRLRSFFPQLTIVGK